MGVRDVLNDGDYDPTRFVVNVFVTPKRIQTAQMKCNNIVESQKHVLEKSDS